MFEILSEMGFPKHLAALVWTVLTYGAEGCPVTKAGEKRIDSAELCIYVVGCYESVGLNTEQTKVFSHRA